MKRFIGVFLAGWLATVAFATPTDGSSVAVLTPWVRAVPPVSQGTAAYMVLQNTGSEDVQLVSASSDIANHVMIHHTVSSNGMSSMQKAGALVIRPGEQLQLKPGGLHIMFMGLSEPLVTGQAVPVSLVFTKAGTQSFTVEVMATVK